MEFVLLFAFAAMFAVAFNFAQPKIIGRFPNYASNFFAVTALTAVAVMVLLLLVSFVFSLVKENPVEVAALPATGGTA
jgi:hypothetical protein